MKTKNYNHTLTYIAAAILGLVEMPSASAQLGLVSQSQELDAGKQADAQIQQQYRISRDPEMNALVRHLGKRLVAVCERSNLSWTFRVIDSKDLNAFSVPGYVYVNSGTIEAIGGDQDALAGVIAHEIGHTCGRHAAKQMEKGTIGSLLVGVFGGKTGP